MLAVLDPNVLISALIAAAGPPRQVLWAWVEGRFELLASAALLVELGDVLTRPKFRRWVSTATATDFVDGLAEAALLIRDPPPLPGHSLPGPRGRLPHRAGARGQRRLSRLRRPAPHRSRLSRPAGAHATPVPRADQDQRPMSLVTHDRRSPLHRPNQSPIDLLAYPGGRLMIFLAERARATPRGRSPVRGLGVAYAFGHA